MSHRPSNKPSFLSFKYVLLMHTALHSSISHKLYTSKTFRGTPIATSFQERESFLDLCSRGWLLQKRIGSTVGNIKFFYHISSKGVGYLNKTSTYGQVARLLEELEDNRKDLQEFYQAARSINYALQYRYEPEDLMSYSHLKFLRLVDNDVLRPEARPYAIYAFQNFPMPGERRVWLGGESERNTALNIEGWLKVLPKSELAKILLTLPRERSEKIVSVARQVYSYKI